MEKAYPRPEPSHVSPECVSRCVAVFGQFFVQQQTGAPNGFPIVSVVAPDRRSHVRVRYQREVLARFP
eukprot:7456309-Lingulodinium_polyedra.AAC.1